MTMDIELTDIQKDIGLWLDPAGDGMNYFLRGEDDISVCCSSDKHEIHKAAFAYSMGYRSGSKLKHNRGNGVM